MLRTSVLVSALLSVGWLGCTVIPLSTGGGSDSSAECIDPLVLLAGEDYACGDEVVVVLIEDLLTGEVFFDVFTSPAQIAETNRWVLINETSFDVIADVSFLVGDAVQVFEQEPLPPQIADFLNTECTEDFVWGTDQVGLCLETPATG